MKIEVLQENLVKALAWSQRFVSSKPALPVLSKVLIEAVKGKVMVYASNMDTGICVEVGAREIEGGKLVVPAKILYEYVNLLPPGKIELVAENGGVRVRSEKYKALIAGESAEEFPEFPDVAKKGGIRLKGGDLNKIVKLVGFAASSDISRPVLATVLFEFGKKKLRAVATDGYRLSLLKGVKYEGEIKEKKILIPAGVLFEVDRLIQDLGEGEIVLGYEDELKSLVFEMGGVKVVSRLVEGDYPDYEKILPKEALVAINYDKDQMIEAIKAALIFARDNANIVKWVIEKDKVVVSARAAGLGEQESEVLIRLIEGGRGEIAFNGRFLIDLLGAVEGGEMRFEMTDALSPGLFKTAEKGFEHVIMPVRTQE